jgi:hypothetical protein
VCIAGQERARSVASLPIAADAGNVCATNATKRWVLADALESERTSAKCCETISHTSRMTGIISGRLDVSFTM